MDQDIFQTFKILTIHRGGGGVIEKFLFLLFTVALLTISLRTWQVSICNEIVRNVKVF